MVRHTGVFADIITCCTKNHATIITVNNSLLSGDKAQSLALTLKCDHKFRDELVAIPGVLGVTYSVKPSK